MDQRELAKQVCTAKELRAYEYVDLQGMSLAEASLLVGVSVSGLRGRLAGARKKVARASRGEFVHDQPRGLSPQQRARTDLATSLLIERDGPNCYLCGHELTAASGCVEHIVPKFVGGTDEASNLGLACRGCNSRKGSLVVSQHRRTRAVVYHPR